MLISLRRRVYLLLSVVVAVALLGVIVFAVRPPMLGQKPAQIPSQKLRVQEFLPPGGTAEQRIDTDLDRDGTKETFVGFKPSEGITWDHLMLLKMKKNKYQKVYEGKLPGELVKILAADLHGDSNARVVAYYKRLGRYAMGESKAGILVFAFKGGSLFKEWGKEWFDDEPKARNLRLIKTNNPKRQAIALRSLSVGASGGTESVRIYGWRAKAYREFFSIDLIFGHGMGGSFRFLESDSSGIPMFETTEVADTVGDYGAISTPVSWRISKWKWNGLRYVGQSRKTRSLSSDEVKEVKKLQEEVKEGELEEESYWKEMLKILPESLSGRVKL